MWLYRERLNYYEKLRRSLYEILRDALELKLMKLQMPITMQEYQRLVVIGRLRLRVQSVMPMPLHLTKRLVHGGQ